MPVEQKKAEGAVRENEVLLQRRKGPTNDQVPNNATTITVCILITYLLEFYFL